MPAREVVNIVEQGNQEIDVSLYHSNLHNIIMSFEWIRSVSLLEAEWNAKAKKSVKLLILKPKP